MLKSVKIGLVLCALLSLMTAAVMAQAPPVAPAPGAGGANAVPGGGMRTPPVMGTISAVDAMAKTVKVKAADGKETSFTTDDKTIVTMVKAKDQAPAPGKLDDLKTGMAVRVNSADGKLAGRIMAAPTAADFPVRGNRGAGAPGAAPAAPAAPVAPAPAPAQ